MRGGLSRPVLVVAALGAVLVALPLVALAIRAPWSELGDVATEEALREAVVLSVATSTVAAVVAVVLGVAIGHGLAHTSGRAAGAVRAIVSLPLVLPPVAAGVALLLAFGRNGVLGDPLEWAGVELPFSTAAVVLAQIWVALPFVAMTAEAGFRALDPGQLEVAATLGAAPTRRFWRVDLPLARGAVATGGVLAWARSLGELGATITFAGVVPGVTETAPLRLLAALETDPESAVLLSVVMMALSIAVLATLRSRWVPLVGQTWGRRG